MFDIGF